jgi:DHA1 family tetracycline resistance protein-like MFS transporter
MQKSKPLIPLFVTIFLDMMGVGIAIPILAVAVIDPHQSILPASIDTATRSVLYGFLLAIFPLMQFFGAPLLGAASDRHGRKGTLILSLCGTLLGYVLFAIGIQLRNVPLLFLSRAIDGFTGGNISIALSSVADLSKNSETKARNFGYMGMAFGLGLILGPMIGGLLSDSSIHPGFTIATPFLFAASLTAINIALFALLYKETLTTRTQTPLSLLTGFTHIKRAFELNDLKTILLVVFLLTLGFNFFTQFFQVFLIAKFRFDQGDIGIFFGFAGLCIALVQGLLVRPMTRRYKLTSILGWNALGFGVTLPLLLVPERSIYVYALIPLLSVFQGLLDPAATTIVSAMAGDDMQGEIIGIKQSFQALSAAIPPIIAGFVSSIHMSLPIIAASICTLVAWAIYIVFFETQQSTAKKLLHYEQKNDTI